MVVIVVVVFFFTITQERFELLYCNLAWSRLSALNPNLGVNFTYAEQPNLPTSQEWANLTNFHPIEFKFGAEVVCKPPDGI